MRHRELHRASRIGWLRAAVLGANDGLISTASHLALEGLARRDFSMRVKEKLLIGGFVLLLMLMVTVIYNDLTRVQWIENLMFWR